jgi:hypothetical protein
MENKNKKTKMLREDHLDLHTNEKMYLCFKSNTSEVGLNSLSDHDVHELLMIFSPRMMKWSDGVWIVDLTPTYSYWKQKLREYNLASKKNISLNSMFSKVLETAFDFESEVQGGDVVGKREANKRIHIGKKEPYLMSMADHPWVSLILCLQMNSRRMSGVVSQGSSLSTKLLREMSWDALWGMASEYSNVLERSSVRRSTLQGFNKDLRSFKLAILRLNLKAPLELRGADEVQIGRRFGSLCSRIWEWTRMSLYPQTKKTKLADNLFSDKPLANDFVWLPYVAKSKLSVATSLDFTAQNWSEIEEVIRQDLVRLCEMDGWGSEDKVVCLEWSVVTDKAIVCPIQINFRMPHHLRGENPHHKTALRQAHYNFEKMDYYLSDFNPFKAQMSLENILNESSLDLEDGEKMDLHDEGGIVGWHLDVKDRIVIPTYLRSLFGFESSNDSLSSLMNRVKVEMTSFDVLSDWLPEDSFEKSNSLKEGEIVSFDRRRNEKKKQGKRAKEIFLSENKKRTANKKLQRRNHASSKSRYLLSHFERPLFMLESSQPTSDPEGPVTFLERSMDKWWKKDDGNYRRDYYLSKSEEQFLWLYKDVHGRWFKHGIFS